MNGKRLKYIPKHIPQRPVRTTNKITQRRSPCLVNSKTEKLNTNTSAVWKHITENWQMTCEKRISIAVTPDTKHRSSIPSFLSINMAPDVKATDKKKMILHKKTKNKRKTKVKISKIMKI